jgi:hypothetical protein
LSDEEETKWDGITKRSWKTKPPAQSSEGERCGRALVLPGEGEDREAGLCCWCISLPPPPALAGFSSSALSSFYTLSPADLTLTQDFK